MAHLVSRGKVIVLGVLVVVLGALAVVIAVWPRSAAHPGGDPGGRLMAKIAPVVRVVPGFHQGRIPWIGFPCDSCQFPVTYAIKIEPRWDSCDGIAGTFGWDPVAIQIGFPWTGSSRALVKLLNERLSDLGWGRGGVPSWSSDQGPDANWISPSGPAPAEVFALDSPLESHRWMATIEAKPQGPLVHGC